MPQTSRRAAWTARAWALSAGLAAGLAHPPFGVLPGLLGFAVLLWLLDLSGPRRLHSAFFRAWLAGVGYFAIGVWWIVEPFQVDAVHQGWMAPIALILMAGGLALFWGLAGLAYRAAKPRGPWRLLVFAGSFAFFEWLRGHVFTGFPWDLPGEAWAAGGPVSQTAAAVGAYGLTWITVALAALPVLVLEKRPMMNRALFAVSGLAVLGALYAYGLGRLSQGRAEPAFDAPLIRVVQADIDQKDKWKPENLPMVFGTYVGLTRRAAEHTPDVVIWPEGALPAVIDDLMAPDSPYGPLLRDAIQPGQTLMMGANRAQGGADGRIRYFNSLIAFHREAQGLRITAIYDKYRLVPFGEYMPLGDLATKVGFRSLVHMPDDFSGGPPPRPLTPWGVPAVQPLICYEALFPGFTREGTRVSGVRPAWILNISNDAWFGRTSGPLQHLNLASYRAIEEGLPIVRATPTGVSAVIDAFGRVVPGKRLGLGAIGVIDARLPPALSPTPYDRFGDLGLALMLAASILAAAPGLTKYNR
jgi:apolipoprotein N-acyltransferase